jgi:hypothetical protein
MEIGQQGHQGRQIGYHPSTRVDGAFARDRETERGM